jgi:hypothetical protein
MEEAALQGNPKKNKGMSRSIGEYLVLDIDDEVSSNPNPTTLVNNRRMMRGRKKMRSRERVETMSVTRSHWTT